MSKKAFKENFISTFLASWCASHWDDYCSRGLRKELENPPIEDAIFLANKAWTKYREVVKL